MNTVLHFYIRKRNISAILNSLKEVFKMGKFLVKLGLNKKTVPQKIVFGGHIFSNMSGNLLFPTPAPYTLLALQTATLNLNNAHDAATGGGVLATATMHEMEVTFDVIVTAMGKYVDGIAQGSDTIILSAGMETKRRKTPSGIPAQVTGLEAMIGVLTGQINLNWLTVAGKLIYLVYMKVDGQTDSQYVLVATPSKSKATIGGLTAGTRYWFKVEAVGSGNKVGAFSDPATNVAAY
jgi:hypothetical protein